MPMRYSLAGTLTLTWPEVADAARTAERLGFDAFYSTDHLMGVAALAAAVGLCALHRRVQAFRAGADDGDDGHSGRPPPSWVLIRGQATGGSGVRSIVI